MERIICLVLCILFLCGCQSQNAHEAAETRPDPFRYDDNGNRFSDNSDGTSAYVKAFPCSIDHNGKTVTLVDVTQYQLYSESNHSYTLFVVATYDLSELDEHDAHWLQNEDIRHLTRMTNAKNECEDEKLNDLGSLYVEDTKTLYIVDCSSFWSEYRYDFTNSELTFFATLEQEEEYDGFNKSNSFLYSWTSPDVITDVNEIPDVLEKYITKWLGQTADFYGSILD